MVIAYLFGATGLVSVFRVAATIIQTLYDFLIGGMVSAALVPVFSDFAAKEKRDELWRVASIVLNVLAIFLALAVLLLELFAPQLVWLLGSGYTPELQRAAVDMLRLVLPAVFFLGMSGIVTGLLYSLKRFTYPAFTTAAYNAGIVIVALALTPTFGITSLIIGIIVGAALQVALQIPGLRDMHYRFAIDFAHPALRKILKLYAPVVAGLSISVVAVVIDRNLASHTGDQSLAWMQNATVLVQLPLGLVATAISFAILPVLSRQATENKQQTTDDREVGFENWDLGFRSTLAFGIKLVLLLILPATIGLFILARPIVALLFERGAFTPNDTAMTARALQFYLLGLPFAAIDQPLVFAFYARKNTWLPNLVQFIAVGIYLVVALALLSSLGFISLVIANSAMLTGHALIMLWLTRTRLGGFGQSEMLATTIKIIIASMAMSAAVLVIEGLMDSILLQVVLSATMGGAIYLAMLWLLRVREAERVWQRVLARIRR